MKKYEPKLKSNSTLRKKLFESFESKELRYKHSIPIKAVQNTLKKLGLESNIYPYAKGGKPRGMDYYRIYDKQGNIHGMYGIETKTNTITNWSVN